MCVLLPEMLFPAKREARGCARPLIALVQLKVDAFELIYIRHGGGGRTPERTAYRLEQTAGQSAAISSLRPSRSFRTFDTLGRPHSHPRPRPRASPLTLEGVRTCGRHGSLERCRDEDLFSQAQLPQNDDRWSTEVDLLLPIILPVARGEKSLYRRPLTRVLPRRVVGVPQLGALKW